MINMFQRILTQQHAPAQQRVLAIINNLPQPLEDNLRFIVGKNPSENLIEYVYHIAWSMGGQWYFDKPEEGWRVWVDYEYPDTYNLLTKTFVGGTYVDCEYIFQKFHIIPFGIGDYLGDGPFWQKSITTTTIRHLEEELEPTHVIVINENKTIGYACLSYFCGSVGSTGYTGYTGDTGDTGITGITGDIDDFWNFPSKIPFVDEDVFIIEDSEDDYKKKKTHIFSLDLKRKDPAYVLVIDENKEIGYSNIDRYRGPTGVGITGDTGDTGPYTFWYWIYKYIHWGYGNNGGYGSYGRCGAYW
jgi:hypothetical protein